jgi:hypothetical protein
MATLGISLTTQGALFREAVWRYGVPQRRFRQQSSSFHIMLGIPKYWNYSSEDLMVIY